MFTCMETESFDAVTERRTRKRAGRCAVQARRCVIDARPSAPATVTPSAALCAGAGGRVTHIQIFIS